MHDKTLRALQRENARRLDKFMARLQSATRPVGAFGTIPKLLLPGFGQGLAGLNPGTRLAQGLQTGWQAVYVPIRELALSLGHLATGLLRWPWRRIALGGLATTVTAAALAASQVVYGYHAHPAAYWEQRLTQRLGSPIFSADRQLQGTLFPAAKDAAGLDYASYGYIRPQGSPPELWQRSVIALEQKTLFNPWRSWCGIDPLGIIKRIVTGSGGGSGLAQQNAKNLMEPEERRSRSRIGDVIDKPREAGGACALHLSHGGAQGMLNLYAAYAPVAQASGVTRGEEAGAWVLFNADPSALQPFQQALLAALAQRPLSLVPQDAFAKGCATLTAMKTTELSKDEVKAARQCSAIGRARVALREVLPAGAERDAQIAKLDALEATGIVPANPFAPLPTRKLVNLSTRTQAALSPALVQRIASEAEDIDSPAGTPLTLTMSQPVQFAFSRSVRAALKRIDESTQGRETLCVPLAFGSPMHHCPGTPDTAAQADVVLARMSVRDGGITRLYESSRLAFAAQNAIGSVGKMVIAMVAVQHGYTPDTLVCPRQARDGGRLLRRVTQPVYGFKQCGAKELIPFTEVMARSDNLGAYEVARALPSEALRQGIAALGLTADADPKANLAYALAFGTQAGTPSELLTLGQALFGVAFDVPARSGGPRLLASNQQEAPAYAAVRSMLPGAAQRQALRTLLQAPVQHPQGTLHFLQNSLAAGKTGTTSASFGPKPGVRPYVQAKYTLGYVPADQSVVLSIINAPSGHGLGLAQMNGSLLEPAIQALLQ